GVAVYATTAWSAPGAATPAEKALLKDVATLKKQVKTLQKQQTTITKAVGSDELALAGTILFTVCGNTLAADALQGTWQEVDQLSAAVQAGKTIFGPQTPLTATIQGKDICDVGGISRSQVLPPTVAGYQALLSQFNANNEKLLEAYLSHH